jgi:hypothetical protein
MLCTGGPSVAVTNFLFLAQNLYYNTDLVGITRLSATRSLALSFSRSPSPDASGARPLDTRALRDNDDAGDTSGQHMTPRATTANPTLSH